jgi:signal peptidase II
MNKSKLFLTLGIISFVLIIDQWVKYYIKTHFFLGEEINVMGEWFKIHFTENYGMAFGLEFGGKSGKIVLTLFRLIAIGMIGYYVYKLAMKNASSLALISWSLIWAGAVGNVIDSVFYGVFFGYETWFHGRVVDMFYFPIIRTTIPESFPFWAGEDFEFFRPVFNVADASISIGFVFILLFQKHVFITDTAAVNADEKITHVE